MGTLNPVVTSVSCVGLRIALQEDGQEVGHAYLYLLGNDLHEGPFGFLEDVFVVEEKRGLGTGGKLLKKVLETAKELGCYKLVATSRSERPDTHAWYERLGFARRGFEFRMDFNKTG